MIPPVGTAVQVALVAGQVLNTIKDIVKYLRIAKGNTSLTEITKVARVEPLVIIGNDCVNLEYSTDVLNSVLTLFTGYYLQAVALTTNISGIKVGKFLDRLNPNSDPNSHISRIFESINEQGKTIQASMHPEWKLCAEAYKYRLPVVSKNKAAMERENSLLVENSGDLASMVGEVANLSVGKLIEVTIVENGQKAVVPITIRLMVNQVMERSLITMLTLRTMENTFSERFHAWRAGRISFIKDLMLCQDMVTAHKKALMADKDNVLTEIIDRSNNSKVSGLFTQQVNLASASNIYIVSEQTAAELEQKLGGKLSNPRIREALFESGYMMILVVIDRAWERVTFYHRGISASTNLGVKDIKSANKGSGPDISQILRAYQMGNSPSF